MLTYLFTKYYMPRDFLPTSFDTPTFLSDAAASASLPIVQRPVDIDSVASVASIDAALAAPSIPLSADLNLPPQADEIVVTATKATDHRVRLSAFRGQEDQVYGTRNKTLNIMAKLHETHGLLFPYTPSISVSQDTSWQTAELENVNYDILSFQKTSSATISLTAKFTVQNQREGEYMLAAIHFLRTVSKAYFGASDVETFDTPVQTDGSDVTANANQVAKVKNNGKAGLPPPVLLLSGYGDMMFNDLRVVVKSHSWSFDESMDMVKIILPQKFPDAVSDSSVWLPPMLTITLALAIQQNTDRLREEFSLDEFRTGALLTKKGWF